MVAADLRLAFPSMSGFFPRGEGNEGRRSIRLLARRDAVFALDTLRDTLLPKPLSWELSVTALDETGAVA